MATGATSRRSGDAEHPLWIVIVLPIAKILLFTTSLSMRHPADPGGLFGPGVVIGAFVGARSGG